MADLRLGEGEEYELRAAERVVIDPKIVAWRRNEFMRMGFDLGDADALAARADVDLHRVADWLQHGCTLRLALKIVAAD